MTSTKRTLTTLWTEDKGSISFQTKLEKIDWRKIASINIDKVVVDGDSNQLKELLSQVTFCNADTEFNPHKTDPAFLKVFQLSQLMTEYLLQCHEHQNEKLKVLEAEKDEISKDLQHFKVALTEAKRNLKQQRNIINATQTELGHENYKDAQCLYCFKKFMNDEYLLEHIQRRHQGLPVGAFNSWKRKRENTKDDRLIVIATSTQTEDDVPQSVPLTNPMELDSDVINDAVGKYFDRHINAGDNNDHINNLLANLANLHVNEDSPLRSTQSRKSSVATTVQNQDIPEKNIQIRDLESQLSILTEKQSSEFIELKETVASELKKMQEFIIQHTVNVSSEDPATRTSKSQETLASLQENMAKQVDQFAQLQQNLQSKMERDFIDLQEKFHSQEELWRSKLQAMETTHHDQIDKLQMELARNIERNAISAEQIRILVEQAEMLKRGTVNPQIPHSSDFPEGKADHEKQLAMTQYEQQLPSKSTSLPASTFPSSIVQGDHSPSGDKGQDFVQSITVSPKPTAKPRKPTSFMTKEEDPQQPQLMDDDNKSEFEGMLQTPHGDSQGKLLTQAQKPQNHEYEEPVRKDQVYGYSYSPSGSESDSNDEEEHITPNRNQAYRAVVLRKKFAGSSSTDRIARVDQMRQKTLAEVTKQMRELGMDPDAVMISNETKYSAMGQMQFTRRSNSLESDPEHYNIHRDSVKRETRLAVKKQQLMDRCEQIHKIRSPISQKETSTLLSKLIGVVKGSKWRNQRLSTKKTGSKSKSPKFSPRKVPAITNIFKRPSRYFRKKKDDVDKVKQEESCEERSSEQESSVDMDMSPYLTRSKPILTNRNRHHHHQKNRAGYHKPSRGKQETPGETEEDEKSRSDYDDEEESDDHDTAINPPVSSRYTSDPITPRPKIISKIEESPQLAKERSPIYAEFSAVKQESSGKKDQNITFQETKLKPKLVQNPMYGKIEDDNDESDWDENIVSRSPTFSPRYKSGPSSFTTTANRERKGPIERAYF